MNALNCFPPPDLRMVQIPDERMSKIAEVLGPRAPWLVRLSFAAHPVLFTRGIVYIDGRGDVTSCAGGDGSDYDEALSEVVELLWDAPFGIAFITRFEDPPISEPEDDDDFLIRIRLDSMKEVRFFILDEPSRRRASVHRCDRAGEGVGVFPARCPTLPAADHIEGGGAA